MTFSQRFLWASLGAERASRRRGQGRTTENSKLSIVHVESEQLLSGRGISARIQCRVSPTAALDGNRSAEQLS